VFFDDTFHYTVMIVCTRWCSF